MPTPRVLIIDDEPDIRELLEITLGRMNLDTASVVNTQEAYAILQAQEFQLCLTDMNLPDGTGIDIIRFIQQHKPELPVAVITAYGSMDLAITALKAGAFDFVSKPVELSRLRELVTQAIKLSTKKIAPSRIIMLGESSAIELLRKQISRIARSQAPVYINGESGTGKELVARMIHEQSARSDQSFVAVNCGAVPAMLVESEFFGHKKGSFTGASSDKSGLFQAAHGGTLFLDEIADLPLVMQVKLLRALQEKKIRAIGSQSEIDVDVRILSATHKDLTTEVEEERFRQDLFFRINVIELTIPPLRERDDDRLLLANYFLDRLAREYGLASPILTTQAVRRLYDYPFPGNVRELENTLERAFTLCENGTITPDDLNLKSIPKATPQPHDRVDPIKIESLEEYLEAIEKQTILDALQQNHWNRTVTAKQLGITFRALRYRMKKLNIEESE